MTSLPAAGSDLQSRDGELRLFLLDMMLVGTTGIEVARILRANGFADTPMIAMSASGQMLRAATDSRLFAATLPKPFELTHLLETVSRFTDQAA